MLRITAIIAAYNEADIIHQSVGALLQHGIGVYLLDNHSTDGTVEALTPYLATGMVTIERFPADPPAAEHRYEHGRIMARKQQLAVELDADWFISHDADEFRESPWSGLTLHEGIERVDRLGYNAIDFAVFNFVPTHDGFDPAHDIRDTFLYFEEAARWDRLQVKCWKKAADVELVTSGGHEAQFASRRIFPIRFLLRHYPIRGQAHGEQKVFQDRKARFADEDRQRGWHVQYNDIASGHQFIRDTAALHRYDPDLARTELMLRHRGVEELEVALSREREQLARVTAQALNVENALTAARSDMDALRRDLGLATEALEDKARALDDSTQRIQTLVTGLDTRLRQVGSLQDVIDAQTRQITDLYRSWSWRTTRPLRAVYELLTAATSSAPVFDPPTGAHTPPQWGDLARLSPVSAVWGTDRGLPVDRHYIHQFLDQHRFDVQGRVLEIKDPHYARTFGDGRVREVEILDIDRTNPNATVFADLASADGLPANQFDCFILTQTVHIIYDIKAALSHSARLLKPGGVLLCTIPAVSRVNYEDGGIEGGDFWRLTRAAVLRLFAEVFGADQVQVSTYGNIRACTAFLYGLAVEDLNPDDLAYHDPWFPLIHGVRAAKPLPQD